MARGAQRRSHVTSYYRAYKSRFYSSNVTPSSSDTSAARRSELPDHRRHARQLIALEVQLRQRRELPDLRRHARQLIAGEVTTSQRRELPDLRRQARQLIAAEAQQRQRGELPDLRRHSSSADCREVQPVSDVSCPISAGTLVS